MVVNGRPLKRMKRRVTADLHDFLTFPSSVAGGHGPFRVNVRKFLTEHALFPPPSSLLPHLLTWQISFRVGEQTDGPDSAPSVVCVDVVEEDVAKSRSVYCDQCRVVGWSGNPVCSKRYHFIIKAEGASIGRYHKPCTPCGDILHLSESRCKPCKATTDDLEDWIYQQLEDTTHLLHAVIHVNGYGHLLRVNGREGGSRILSGCHIMNFWDRLCQALGVRKVSVMDVSKKYGLEYRLLHAITKGHPWYGDWGYEFGAGSFALTLDAYKFAVDTLSGMPLSIFLSQGSQQPTLLQDRMSFYQSLSQCQLVHTRELFGYLMNLIHTAHKSSLGENATASKRQGPSGISHTWGTSDIERVTEAMFRVLRAVSGSNWASSRSLRGAVCKVAPSNLLDHCLKELGGKSAADGMVVHTRQNPDSGVLEFRLEPGSPPGVITSGSDSSVIKSSCPSLEVLVHDLRFFYETILNPQTILGCVPVATRDLVICSAEKLLDCKQFVKEYKPEKQASLSPSIICLSCQVELSDESQKFAPNPPPELIILPLNATVADLKRETSGAFQDVYLMFKKFVAEELFGYSGVDDSTQVKLLLGSTASVRVRGRCAGENVLGKYKMERGTERWTVDCVCGTKDDDGERMLACDICGVWQHTRCSDIQDSDSVPARFFCHRCRGSDHINKVNGQCKDEKVIASSTAGNNSSFGNSLTSDDVR